MDKLTKEQRKINMAAVRSAGTNIELLLRKALWSNGIRYRKNLSNLPGRPDIVITKYKIAIFCDGKFWHGKNFDKLKIGTNTKFWNEKIKSNIERDTEVTIQLRDAGWLVFRFWDDELKKEMPKCLNKIIEAIKLRQSNI